MEGIWIVEGQGEDCTLQIAAFATGREARAFCEFWNHDKSRIPAWVHFYKFGEQFD